MSDQDGWHLVGTTGEITEDVPKQVKIGDTLVGLFRVGDEILAIHDVCTHEFACLTDGWVEGDTVECPLRERAFFVGERYSIADIALYAYTHVAHEGDFDLGSYHAVGAWLEHVRGQPSYIPITQG